MNNPGLIIDRPDLQNWRQKAMFGFITAAFWFGWFFLWLPAVTMGAWVVFGYQFRIHMIDFEGYRGFAGLLAIYALVILATGGALIIWAKYNHLRFRGMDRRREAPLPTLAETAQWFGQSESRLLHWRSCAVLTVHHDEHGAVSSVMPSFPGEAAAAPSGFTSLP